MGVKATTIAVTAILLLGGLYLYMNRFEYLHLSESSGAEIYLRINKLTEEECLVWKRRRVGWPEVHGYVREKLNIPFCPMTAGPDTPI